MGLHVLDDAGTATQVLDEADGGPIFGYTASVPSLAFVMLPQLRHRLHRPERLGYSTAEMVDNYLTNVAGNNRGEAW